MEKEISTGTLLVIVLVALAAIIGMGFAVFSIARASELDSIVETLIIPPSVTASSNNAYHTKAGVLLKAPAHLQNYESKLTNSNNTSNKPTLKYYSCGCSTCINKSSYVTVENPY